jgi:Zn-dependent protease
LFGTSWRAGRIAGIEIRIDSSWVVIALLISYSMYLRFSFLYKGLSTWAAVGIAILAAVLFFGSVLVHELAHVLVSRARGIRVQDITLFLFGGATRARVESRGPGDEFLIATVGPLTSGLVAAVFWMVNVFARGALPSSLVWRATGSFRRATQIASVAGQAVGWLLVAGGVAFLLAGNLAGGIWFAFIGWFLVQAARASYQELQVRHLLRGVQAQDAMASDLVRIPPDLTLQDAVDRYLMR